MCAELIRLARTGYEPWVLTRQNLNQQDLDPECSLRTAEINNLTMGKYDHIFKLTGAENYAQWHRQMTLALKGERLWNHCSNGSDPLDLAELAIDKPTLVDPAAVTDAEKEKILNWLAKDAQAKALVDRKISTVVANQLNENQTTREQWDILSERYSRNDILSQMTPLDILGFLKMLAIDSSRWGSLTPMTKRSLICCRGFQTELSGKLLKSSQ